MNITRAEDPSGTDHQKKLLDLLGYLFGDALEHQVESCQAAFRQLHVELWAGRPESEKASEARIILQNLLSQVMSRNERFLHLDFRDVDK